MKIPNRACNQIWMFSKSMSISDSDDFRGSRTIKKNLACNAMIDHHEIHSYKIVKDLVSSFSHKLNLKAFSPQSKHQDHRIIRRR